MQTNLDCILKRFQSTFEEKWCATLKDLNATQIQLTSGSRLRPQLALLGYLVTLEPSRWEIDSFSLAAEVAISVELIHKASLFLDDWIDNDSQRHGLPAFHVENSPEQAVLLAVKMVALSTYRLRGIFPKDTVMPHSYSLCLDTLINTIYYMASGAYAELTINDAELYSFDSAREIARLETSEIIGNSILMGFYSNIGDHNFHGVEERLKEIGDKCGYIFQAMNDLEAFSRPEALSAYKGHVNFDVSARRKNLMVSRLYQVASKRDRIELVKADDAKLSALTKKYHIVERYRKELALEFASLLDDVADLSHTGISDAWCSLFVEYLEIIRRTAEARL